jgi:hypothetical protein
MNRHQFIAGTTDRTLAGISAKGPRTIHPILLINPIESFGS